MLGSKGQTANIFGVMAIIAVFVIIFMFGLAPFQNIASDMIVNDTHPTGLLGMFLGNLALFTFFGFLAWLFYRMFSG